MKICVNILLFWFNAIAAQEGQYKQLSPSHSKPGLAGGKSLRGYQPNVASKDAGVTRRAAKIWHSTTFEIINGDLYEIEVEGDSATNASTAASDVANAILDDETYLNRQKKIWDFIKTFDGYKTSKLYITDNGKPTLKQIKYMMLPIWWDGDDTTDPQWNMELTQIDGIMETVRKYYLDMSWNQTDIQWQTLQQQVLSGVSRTNATFGNSATSARNIVSQNYTEGVDYDSISLVYHTATSGPFSGGGGWANVNGNFMWNSYQMGFSVTRHEVGHNFGHPHHKKHSYEYRNSDRTNMKENWGGLDYGYDGWDMMSGGNGYPVSHFAAASKWFFNWIEDSSIILMQPEGPTAECPTCSSSGSFQLVPFDNKDLPPTSDRKMGIHIPIVVQGSKLYSFWLSYCGGNGAKKGLSVHFTEFSLSGMFGATYDSHRYFAFGDVSGTADAFVLNNTCYHVFPSAYMKDRDYVAANDVQPVVCVDAINESVSINVTVSFIDRQNPPPVSSQVNPVNMVLDCSDAATPVNYSLDANRFNLVHVTNTGANGDISISMCTDNSSFADVKAAALFHDQYPHSAISYDSPVSYGAFKKTEAPSLECCDPNTTINVSGAKVVRIKQNREEFMHLNEIEIFDENGDNVAPDGRCFSYSTGYGGDPNCLNDGLTGTYPETCGSHASWYNVNNFDYCVLDEATTITRIKIWPWKESDPNRSWLTGRLNDITLSVFAEVLGQSESAQFIGELYSERLLDVFTSSQREPRDFNVTLLDTIDCPNTNSNPSINFTYRSDYDNTYIVIPPSIGATTATSRTPIKLSCTVNNCMQNNYKLNGACVSCPSDHYSTAGSTELSACIPCPSGTFLSHKYAQHCSISNSQTEFASSAGWRIWASDLHTQTSWALDISEVEFYEDFDCSGEKISNALGTSIDSGNAGSGWGPDQAFGGSGTWGGRKDADGMFWVGKIYTNPVLVRCVRVHNAGWEAKSTSELRIQAVNSTTNRWENAWIKSDFETLPGAWNTISMVYSPSQSPSESPMTSESPSSKATFTKIPSTSPSKIPTSTPLTTAPTISCEYITNSGDCKSRSDCDWIKDKGSGSCVSVAPSTAGPTNSPTPASPTTCLGQGDDCSVGGNESCCSGSCSKGKDKFCEAGSDPTTSAPTPSDPSGPTCSSSNCGACDKSSCTPPCSWSKGSCV